jgi:hypothetical protein
MELLPEGYNSIKNSLFLPSFSEIKGGKLALKVFNTKVIDSNSVSSYPSDFTVDVESTVETIECQEPEEPVLDEEGNPIPECEKAVDTVTTT